MNKIYKVIFNRNKNRYEIVSELASSRGGKCKVKAGKQIAKLFMTGLLATFLSSVALAADEEVKVKYDAATGTIKIVKVSDGSEVASYAVGGNISPITSIGTEKDKEIVTKNPTGIIAIGDQSKAVQSNSIAIGADAHAGDLTPAKDKEGKDKDYPLDNSNGYIAIGTKAVASGDRSIALGNLSSDNGGSYNIVQGKDSIGIGTSTSVFGYSGVSIGRRNIIGVPDPDLVKEGVLTTKARTKYSENDLGGNSVIVGAYNVAYGNRSNIIGTYSRAMGSNSVAIGSGVQSLSDGAIAIGKGSGYEFADGSRFKNGEDVRGDYYGRDWELPPEYKVLKQVLSNDINGDKPYKKSSSGRKEGKYKYEKGGSLPKYNNYGAGSSDPGGFIVEGQNALGIGTYTQVRGDSAIGLATGEMTAKFPDKDKDKSAYARDMSKIMDMEETLYDAKEALKSGSTSDKATLEANVKTAEESLAAAKKEFRKKYLSKYSFVEGDGALGVGRQILAQGDRSMAVGDFAKAISNDAIAYGGQTLANGTNSMAMGGKAHVGTEEDAFANSMAIGSHTNVQAGNAVALGAFTQVTGTNSLALGFGTQNGDSINYNTVSGRDSTLIGSYSTVQGSNSILIGSSGNIANDRVVALGNNINIAAANSDDQENNTAGSVFLGDHAGYVKDSERSHSLGEVDVVGSTKKMKLTESLSTTKGALRDYTKDFIYIYMLERQDDGTQIGAPIAVRSDFAGGDSTVGVVSVGSTYKQKFKNRTEIEKYHKEVGSLITVPVEVTVQVTKNGIPLGDQQQIRYFAVDAKEEDINNDNTLSDKDKKAVLEAIKNSLNSSDTEYTVFETRRIQNVAPGLIGVNSTDAINGSQLFATNQMLGNLVGSLKKTFGDNVTITEDGQINVSGGGTLGWIAKAKAADGSNGTVNYQVGKDDKITKDNLEKKGSAIEAADQLVFQAGKNIGLVQTPDTLTISTIDTPSFKSVELRGETQNVDGSQVTPVTMVDSNGMQVYTETVTPGDAGSTTTKKVSTTVNNEGVTTDGTVKVTNGKDGNQAKDLVTIGKNVDPNAPAGTDGENGTIGLDGKNGSNATITVDRGTSSLDDKKNIGTDPNRDISKDNPAKMDRITYTTKNKDGNDVITHEVATMDDGLFFSGDSADGKDGNVKNKFDRKLSQETKIIGGVDLGLQADATAEQREAAIAAKLTDGNIGVISDGTDTLTVKLAKQLTDLDSTTYTSLTTKTDDGNATSTMKVDGNGVRFVGNNDTVKNDAPSLTTDGIDGGNKQITNIDSGLKNGNTTISISDLKDPNKTATINPILNNAVNVSDLKTIVDAGFKLNTSGQPTDSGATTVKIGETINVVNGVNTKVSAIDDSTTGTHTFHIDVTGLPVVYTDEDGNKLTKVGDKFYKDDQFDNGTLKPNATPSDAKNISIVNPDGLISKTDGSAPTTVNNVGSSIGGDVNNGAPKDSTINGELGTNSFIDKLNKVGGTENDAISKNAVVTTGDLKNLADTPLFFAGDSADGVNEKDTTADKNAFGRKLSQQMKIVGGVDLGLQDSATADQRQKAIAEKLTDGNIGVVSNGTDTLTIKLAKNLVNLTSVETGSGNNKTKMTENGVTTTVKDGDTFKVTTTTPNGLATTEVKLDSNKMPTGESKTTTVTTDGVTITTQTPKNGDKPASTTETKLSKDGLATDGTVKVTNGKTGDDAKDLVTIGKGTETDPKATDKEFGTVTIDGKNGSNATLTVDRGTKSVTDKANILKDPEQPAGDNNPVSMDRLTYTTTGPNNETINHEVATLDDGFFLTTEHTEAEKTRTVLFNNTIKVLDGANTKVSAMGGKKGTHTFSIDVTGLPMTYTATDAEGKTQDVHKVGDTYTLADGTKLVQVGDKFYKPDQVKEVNGKPQVQADQEDKDTKLNNVSLTSPVGNTAPTLSNVGSALKKSNGTRITMSDLDDGSTYPTDNPIWNNAVNVGDLKAATDAARTEVTGTGEAFVTRKQATDGHTIYNVHVDKILSHKDANGNELVRGGDGKYYTNEEIKDKTYIPSENKWYSNSDLTNGKPNQGAQAVTPDPVDQSNVKTSLVNPNAGVGTGTDTSMTLDNVKSGIGGDAGNNTFIKKLEKVGGTDTDAIDKTTVVNAGDLKNLADTPLFFSGDAADGKNGNVKNTFGRKLSEEAKIVGGQKDVNQLTDDNIGVVSNGTDTLTIKLAKNLVNLTSVETGSGDNKTKMTENGITTTVKDGDTFKVTTTTPNGLATTEVKLDSDDKPTGESTTTTVTTDGVTITTQTPQNGDKPASTTETKLSKDGLATDGTIKVTGDNAKDLVTIAKGTETDPNATDKEFGTVTIDGKNGSNATLTVDRGTKSVTDKANILKDPKQPAGDNNPVSMDRLTYTTTGADGKSIINHEVATLDDGFFLTTSTDVTKGKAAAGVKLNHTIKFTDGANTKVSTVDSKDDIHELHVDVTGLPMTYTVSQTGNASTSESVSKVGDTYQLADGTKLVKVGGKFYKPSQLVDPDADKPQVKPEEVAKDWTVNDSISLVNKDGSNNAPTTLKNVGSGLKDANGKSTTLDKAVGSNAVNVDDLRTLGKAATTEVTGTGAAEVTKVTGADGQNIYNVHVDKLMTVKPVDPKANITRGGDGKYYNADNIAGKTFVSDGNGGGSWYNASDVDAKTGKPLKDKSPLAEQPIALDQSELKNSVVNPNGDGATIVDNVKSGIGGEVKDTSGKNTFIENLDKVGKPASEGGIDKTTVVNAGDLKNLADTPLFFSGDAADDKEYNGAKNTKNTFGRKLSEEAKIVGGQTDITKLTDNNIGVVSNGTDTLTIKLAKDLTDLHSVTTTDDKGNTTQINGKGLATTADDGKGNIKITTVTSDGITIVTTDKDGNNSVSLTNKGLDNGHHQIINVKSGLLDRQGKPVTLKNASGDILNNAVNVRDLHDVVQGLTDSGKGGGFGLTGNNGEVRKSLGETITLKGGIANKLENGIDMNKPEKATTDKNTYIDVKTSENGSEKIMVVEIAKDLTDLNSAEFTDQEGNTTKMKGDGIYIDKNGDGNADISLTSGGLNNGGNKITNVADGTEDTDAVNVSQLNKLKQEIKQNIGDEINELNAYAPVVYLDKDGNRVIRKGNKFVKKNDETAEIPPQDIRLSLVNADGKTTTPSTLQNVAKGVKDTDAVNVKQLTDATEKPLTFNGDAGSSSAKLGETVAIKGGANSADLTDNNIGVIANSSTKTLNVKLSKKLKGLESAEFVDNNGNTTNITGDGVHISGGNGSNVSLTSQGLNNGGNRITNVAPGVEATDAVNVSQLTQVGAALHNRINNVAKGAYGGVASAGAMASLPQAYLPGKSMVAAGTSHYRGESAVALGASRISDNGKIILKLNASHNTSGNTMVGAGVGYQF